MTHLERVANDLVLANPDIPEIEFLKLMQECKVWEYPWGVIFAKDNHMHIHILTDYRRKVFLRKPLREVAFFMFSRFHEIKTSVLKNKPDALNFDLRMGWKLERETAEAWHLKMKKEDFNYGKSR